MTTSGPDPVAGSPHPTMPAFAPVGYADGPEAPVDLGHADEPYRRPIARIVAGAIAAVLMLVWTALFVWSQQSGDVPDARTLPWLIALWSLPMLLIMLAWQLVLSIAPRGAAWLGGSTRAVEELSDRLELRLVAVNRELSLAREFIAAQSRDLESIGRLAAERLRESGLHLQGLVQANAAQVDTIAGTSRVAVDNMEQLRAQLPVLANATRDLGNTVGSAGQTAQHHAAELQRALVLIADAGAANAAQIEGLRQSAGATVDELTHRGDQLATIATSRFDALTAQGQAFRAQRDADEAEALAAQRARAEALRSDAEAIAATLRSGEAAALARWRENAARVTEDVSGAMVLLDNAERDAFAASHQRLLALSDDAERVDALLDERTRGFAAALDERRRAAASADEHSVVLFAQRLEELDTAIAARQAAQTQRGEQLVEHAETIVTRLGQSEARMTAIVAQGRQARDDLDAQVRALITALADGRETLAGVDGDVRALITSSERVRDLVAAAARQSHDELPDVLTGVLADGEAQVRALHDGIAALRGAIGEAGERGDVLSDRLMRAAADTRARLDGIAERQSGVSADAVAHIGHLEAIEEHLRDIIDLEDRLAVRAETDFAATLGALVRDMTDAGATAFDRALRGAAAQTAGRIEQAAAHAAGVGGEAASRLRSEIAHVEAQTAALEARIAAAQARTETPLDRDFARRTALITDSLNSNAIDIASALATDLPDTAWAEYLRGDHGVFTRRAVRLLDRGQSRAIVSLYEGDAAFRDHVSRYIHDFEAILRELLAAREGHELAVTMLSSDMGKLYVALAQAIERLRG